MIQTIKTQYYKKQEDGTTVLVKTTSEEVELPSTEEIIADKEAQMLKMYNEIQSLKENK